MKNKIVGVIVGLLALFGVGVTQLGGTFERTQTLIDGAVSTDFSGGVNVADYAEMTFQFSCENAGTSTVKFAGSNSDDAPTFSSTATASNHWDYIDVIDLEDGSSIDGDTGISCAGVTDIRNLSVNTDLLTWVAAEVSAYTSGTSTVKLRKGASR